MMDGHEVEELQHRPAAGCNGQQVRFVRTLASSPSRSLGLGAARRALATKGWECGRRLRMDALAMGR